MTSVYLGPPAAVGAQMIRKERVKCDGFKRAGQQLDATRARARTARAVAAVMSARACAPVSTLTCASTQRITRDSLLFFCSQILNALRHFPWVLIAVCVAFTVLCSFVFCLLQITTAATRRRHAGDTSSTSASASWAGRYGSLCVTFCLLRAGLIV